MKPSLRWIGFGLLAVGIIALLLVFGANKKLRQKLTALLLEKKIKTEISNLKDTAIIAKAKADANKISAEEAEQVSKAADEAISKQKTALQEGLKKKGLTADEITDRFKSLGV